MSKYWPFPLIFFSGLAALSYQMVWMREFRFIFGASTAATAAVSALFMAGLGLGGRLFGPRADRTARPLLLYGRLELAIAILAGLSPWLLKLARNLYLQSGGVLTLGLTGATAARLALAAAAIGLPALLMGGTLPAAAKAATGEGDGSRLSLAALYGVNTLGALTGAFLTVFWALETLGSRDALTLAVTVNFLVALAAIALGRRPAPAPASAARPDTAEEETGAPLPLILAAAAVAGFAFFLMELVWYRLLAPVLGGSVYTFGLILALALAGIGLGGALNPLLFLRRRPQAWHLAVVCLLEALALMFPFALGDWLAAATAQLRTLAAFGFWGLAGSWSLIAGLVVLPAALVSGVQFPLLISLLGRGTKNLGRQTGLAYAYNTGGAIIGSLAGGFGFLPWLTAPGCWRLAGALLLVLGLAVAWAARSRGGLSRPALAFMAAIFVLTSLCFIAPGPQAAWRHSPIGAGRVPPFVSLNQIRSWMSDSRRNIVWERDGVESAVGIDQRNGYTFLVNGKADGNVIGDKGTQIMSGLIGAALHPEPRRALVVGLGTGSTAGWLSAVETMEQVDVVELEPAVLEIARLSAKANLGALARAEAGDGIRIIFNDAREVLNTTPDRYDLIVSEPSNPYRAGIASLFTREFYQAAAARLNPGGLFVGWCQAYEIETTTVFTILATLKSVFPYVECWDTQGGRDLVFVAAMEPPNPEPDRLAARLAGQPYAEALRIAWGAEGLAGFLAHRLAGDELSRTIARIIGPAALNTDDLSPVEYAYAHSVGHQTRFSALDLFALAQAKGQHRPAWTPADLTQEILAFNMVLSIFYNGGDFGVYANILPETLKKRIQALHRWGQGDYGAQPGQWGENRPDSRLESLALAESLARLKDERALTLLGSFEDWWPACAAMVRSFLAAGLNRPEEAVGELEKAFQRLRQSPWEVEALLERGLRSALDLGALSPQYAGRLYAALEEPFALSFMETSRSTLLLDLAERIGPEKAAETLERLFEPNPIWNEVFLKKRLAIYAAAKSWRLAQARDDLKLFLSSSDPSVADMLPAKTTTSP